jgi:hypothetical protein
VASAEENAPASKPADAPVDAMAEAQREFQSIKAARGAPADQSVLSLPRMATPELQFGSSPSPATPALQNGPAKNKLAASWLVDGAMRKPRAGSSEKSLSDGASQSSGRDTVGADESRNRGSKNGGAGADDSIPAKQSGPESNPLTRYMAGWMTPRDYALLRPGLGGEMASDLAGRGDPSITGFTFGAASANVDGTDPASGFAGTAAGSTGSQPANVNPFLQSVARPPQPQSPFIPPSATGLSTNPPNLLALPAEPAPARSIVPEFAKPSEDAKYFKQLKRF